MEDIKKRIENNNSILQKLLKNPQAKRSLYDWLLTELAYTSNSIEGNTLTRKETALVIKENITAGAKPVKDYLEAKNHAQAFEYILKLAGQKTKIKESEILAIHNNILQGIDNNSAGIYRNVRVRIAGSNTVLPNPLKVPQLMKEFCGWLNTSGQTVEKAVEAHFRIVSIHPFVDGNGRTARLLMNLMLIKNGYAPLIVRPRDRKLYISTIERAQVRNDRSFYDNFMLHALNRSLETYISFLDNDAVDEDDENLLTISEFAREAKLPVSTIRYYLRAGKLKPVAKTQSDYMLFSKEQIKKLKN